jgi:branched-chain amino acid transport system substrate-binding protein
VTQSIRRAVVALASLGALTIPLAACGRSGSSGSASATPAASPGITDTQVTLGSSQILTGPASAYAVLAQTVDAYFKAVNAAGGIQMADGKTRKVKFVYYDDAFDPSRAVANMHRLVQQDQVFATFGQAGSSSVAAAQDFLNAQKVPQLFVFSGDSVWGTGAAKKPWTLGCPPAYTTEAAFYAQYLGQVKPHAKVAVLYENDDLGNDLLGGFKAAIAGTGIKLVAQQSYAVTDPTVDSQIVNLAHSGADVLLDVSTPKFAAAAIAKVRQTGWKPIHLLAAVSASAQLMAAVKAGPQDQIVSYAYVKDPASPAYANDPGVQQFRSALKQYAPKVDPNDQIAADAWACSDAMKAALAATKAPTRAALMDAARHLDGVQSGMLVPGAAFTTNGTADPFPLESGQIERWSGKGFAPVGKVISFEGRTPRT